LEGKLEKKEKLKLLIRLLSIAPTHKGAENLRSDIKSRISKLRKEIKRGDKKKKLIKRKGIIRGIAKQGIQVVIYGKTNSGKSLLLSKLTKAKPKVANYKFTTTQPEVGMLNFNDVDFQFIELPALTFTAKDHKWLSFLQTCDLILALSSSMHDSQEVINYIKRYLKAYNIKKRIIGISFVTDNQFKRKKNDAKGVIYITCNIDNVSIIKQSIFSSLKVYRIYLRPPKKNLKERQPDKKPVVFTSQPTVKDVLDKIHKPKEKVKNIKVYGSSVKFEGQSVNVEHKLNDNDVIEFYL